MRRALTVALLLSLAAGCGQKGSLYLRDEPPPGVRAEKPEAYQPVPYPKPAREEPESSKKK